MQRAYRLRCVWALLLAGLQAGSWAGQPGREDEPRLHAAVYLVRGSVSGANIGSYGPFVLNTDGSWRRLSLSNLITCGFGMDRAGTGRRLYLAAGNGVHRSTDAGRTWRILTGWRTMEILTVLPDRTDSATIYAATPWGVHKSVDDGRTWIERSRGFRHWFVRHIVFDLRDPATLYATAEDDLYRSRDGAGQWSPLGVGGGSILAFLQHPARPGILLAGAEDRGIFRSTDDGRTWHQTAVPAPSSIYAFAASPDGGSIYAGGWETGIWRSTDDGATWRAHSPGPQTQALFCLLVDGRQPERLYAGTDGNGVFLSDDGGGTWRCIGLEGGKIKHLMFYP